METGLEGKSVLVTGAAGRIGSACCAVFAAEGAQVVCADVDGQAAAMTALMLGGTPAAGDVTRPADAERTAGVVALTKSLAREAGPLGIRANCVQPGFIATPRTETLSEESRQEIIGRTPLGRIGEPEEVAAAVVWPASDRASFINGAHIDVSGGLHMD